MYRFSFDREKIIVRGISAIRAISQRGNERLAESESGTPGSVSTTKQFSARIIRQASNLAPNSACFLSRADQSAVPKIETSQTWIFPGLEKLITE